jgi:hypothetical protein
MNPLALPSISMAPRDGQLRPIAAILPEVLRHYDLLPPAGGAGESRPPLDLSAQLVPSRTTSLATIDGIRYY